MHYIGGEAKMGQRHGVRITDNWIMRLLPAV